MLVVLVVIVVVFRKIMMSMQSFPYGDFRRLGFVFFALQAFASGSQITVNKQVAAEGMCDSFLSFPNA